MLNMSASIDSKIHNRDLTALKMIPDHRNETNPMASVIVITRNRSTSLARTLEALTHLDYPAYEVIVADNASTDDTAKVAAEFSARYLFCPLSYGISRCRKEGVEAARGEIIAFCDDDCVPVQDWLQHIVRRLQNEQDLGLLGGQVINIGFEAAHQYKGRQKWTNRNGKLAFAADPKEAEFFGNANLAFRKAVYQMVGGYDPFFIACMAELDLTMKVRRHGFRIDYEPAAVVRHHHTGVNYKRGRFFYDNQLMRLYFYLKHFRPKRLSEWLSFSYREAQLVGDDLYKWSRSFAAAILKVRLQRLPGVATDFFNIISARLAIPWLLWRIRKQDLVAKNAIENRLPSRGIL